MFAAGVSTRVAWFTDSVFLLVIAFLAAGCSEQLSDRNLEEAQMHFEEGRFDDAIAYLDQEIAIKPQSHVAHVTRGRVNFCRRQYDEAISDLNRGRELGPLNAGEQELLARAFLELGEFEQVHITAAELLTTCPHDRTASKLLIGRAHLGQLDAERALEEFTSCRASDPDSREAILFSGVAYSQLKRLAESEKCFDEAIALKPDDAYAYWMRSQVRTAAGKEGLAESDRERARELSPGTQYAEADGASLADTALGRPKDQQVLQHLPTK